ncbi:MAG: O-antigen ligase family protein [Pseudomonadota bacterium]|nr:O-antigen ligase family protein [Pseudomonadota bacterium]
MGALLVIAVLFGGGGARYGLANLVVQLAALGALALNPRSFAQFWSRAPWPVRVLVILTIALPLLQSIPLPPSVWANLPGREMLTLSLEAVGRDAWLTMSVDPRRTLLAASALITPLAVLCVGWSLSHKRLLDLGWLFVAIGLALFALGSIQVVSQGAIGVVFQEREPGSLLLATFANRNSTGVFLVGVLAFALVLPSPRPHPMLLPARLSVAAVLILGIILTQSRTALVLTIIPCLLGAIRLFLWNRNNRAREQGKASLSRQSLFTVGGVVIVGALIAGALVMSPGRVGQTLDRFDSLEDGREFIWEDATYSIARFWPLGAGMGTFDDVFQIDESLENLTKRRAGRAHNDYLEVAIEAGAPGLALVAGWALLLLWLSWRARHSRFRTVAWAGAAFLLAIMGQCVTDYPLRNQTILAAAGFALLVLIRFGEPDEERSR